MPSFSMCPGDHCRMRDQCIRFRAVPSEQQSYYEGAPYSRRDGRCADFSPVERSAGIPLRPIQRTYNDEQPGFTEPERVPEEPASVPGAGEEFEPGPHTVSTPLSIMQSMLRDTPQPEPGGSAPRPFDPQPTEAFRAPWDEPSPGAWMPTTVDLRPSLVPQRSLAELWEREEAHARYRAEQREMERRMRESFISYNMFRAPPSRDFHVGRPTDRTPPPPRPTPPPEPVEPPERMTPEELASELNRGYSFAQRMRQWTRRNGGRRQWRDGG